MGKTAENYWRIIAAEQREPRPRDAVLKDIALALVTNHGIGSESRQGGGANPYDCRLGTSRGDVWSQRRRA
jgi:hypothetical protein